MSIDKILLQLQIDGCCIVDRVIPEDQVGTVRAEAESVTTAKGVSRTYKGLHSARGVLDSVPSFLPHLADRRVLGVAEEWFGPQLRVSFTNTLVNSPGNERSGWHADWPYNQEKAGHIPAPYADFPVQLSTLWMLSDFTVDNGATWIVPGSHRTTDNPTGTMSVDRFESYPTEIQATGQAGSVLLFDSRLWHATASNNSDGPRVGMVVRYAPWWLDLEVLMPGSDMRQRMVEEPGLPENEVPSVPPEVYESLPDKVKPLYRHWVR